jgi:RNA polymerase sigma factor (sigma-70 family)
VEDADAALLAAVQHGSEHAFNKLVDRHQQAVRIFLRGLVSTADADDIAQEAFLVAWSHAHAYRGTASVRSWLFAIAWRKANDHHRRGFRRRQRETLYHRDESHNATAEVAIEERLAVQQALESLPIEQRAALLLCLAGGFSHAEAAEALGFPLGTVKSHVSRGRERLREALRVDR